MTRTFLENLGSPTPPGVSSRISRVTSTPKPVRREVAAFEVFLIPPVRRRAAWAEIACVGDVLDTAPPGDRCLNRFWAYKPATGVFSLGARPCGRHDCPICVVTWLTDMVAPAWVYWAGKANVAVTRGDKDEQKAQRTILDVRIREKNDPTIGALSIPSGTDPDARTIFWPGPKATGVWETLRGSKLNARLLAELRQVAVTEKEPGSREPSLTGGSIPSWRTVAEVRQIIADVIGVDWEAVWAAAWREGGKTAPGVTLEQVEEIRDRIWRR